MTHEELEKKFGGLIILCNGCGKPMRSMGSWPIVYPPAEGDTGATKNLVAYRFTCSNSCRTPSEKFARGYPVLISIIDTE